MGTDRTNVYQVVRIYAEDGVELSGMISDSPKDVNRGILHIHGLAGNFYEQPFIDYISRAAQESGYRFFSINTRGHEYISDAVKVTGLERTSFRAGGAHERLVEAIFDIRAGVKFLISAGINEIVITSHSTGCVKVALYLLQPHEAEIRSTVFISPSDDVGIQKAMKEEEFESVLASAKHRISKDRGAELMPPDTFVYPVDANAYVDLFDPDGIGNIFDVDNIGGGLAKLKNLTLPSAVILGSEDIAVVGDKAEAAERIVDSLGSAASSQWHIIEGADHSYTGKEDELATLVLKCIKALT